MAEKCVICGGEIYYRIEANQFYDVSVCRLCKRCGSMLYSDVEYNDERDILQKSLRDLFNAAKEAI